MRSAKRSTVRAMVMAAGAGTRLRPLTNAVPKPMVPVANRPVLEYTVENLKRHGITEMIFNLHSHPEQIKNHFGDGSAWGVHIEYSYEPHLLGTAGGVKNVSKFLEGGTFLVMSGDGLTTADLTALLRFHRARKSTATMAIKPVDVGFDYGVTMSNSRGRITRFVEKPNWSDVFSNDVNTGIYIFEPDVLSMIPSGQVYDFGHQLWPKLLKKKKPIFAYRTKSYWCDVGSINEYRKAHNEFLEGHTGFEIKGIQIKPGVWVEENVTIEKASILDAPCLIGANSRIEKGAHVGPHSVLGRGSHVGQNSLIQNTILWDDVTIGSGVRLQNCIVTSHVKLNEAISVSDGTIIQDIFPKVPK